MGFFDYFRAKRKENTASLAKERLQIIVAHERGGRRKAPDYLPAMKQEILQVVRKYVKIDPTLIKAHVDTDGDFEVLELNITLPDQDEAAADSK